MTTMLLGNHGNCLCMLGVTKILVRFVTETLENKLVLATKAGKYSNKLKSC